MKPTLLAAAVGLMCVGALAQPSHAQPYEHEGGGDSAQHAQQPDQGSQNGDEEGLSGRGARHAPAGGYAQDQENEATGQAFAPGPAHGPHAGGPPPPPPPHGPPPPPNAARFVFQRGSARIDVTCPQVFALRDCVQAATELLDKIHSLRSGAQAPGASNGPAGGNSAPARGGGSFEQQSAPDGGSAPHATPPDNGGRM
jgi:hypothetical protein